MKKTNIVFGLTSLVLGILFSIALYSNNGVTFRIFIAGPPFFFLGLSLLTIAKGPNKTIEEVKEDSNVFFSEASVKDKIIWGISVVIGLFISNLIFPIF